MIQIKVITFDNMTNIICEVNRIGDEISIKNALYIVPTQDQTGKMRTTFHPFLDYTDEYENGIAINANKILCITTPVLELLNIYNGVFSKIQLASAQSIASVTKIK